MSHTLARKILAVGAAIVCAGALTTACTSQSSPGSHGGSTGSLRWGMVTGGLDSIDPLTLTSGSALLATSYDALLTAGPTGELAPGLAMSWDTPDTLTYIFHLRKNVKFWDGTPMTASDVVASLDYERLAPSPYESLFINVADVKAQSPDTVVVTMKKADASVLSLLASVGASIFEKKFYDADKKDFGKPNRLTMATGPYEIKSLNPTGQATFIANPDWWGGKVAIKNVTVIPFKTITSEALAYRSGQLDAVYPLADPKAFASASGAKLTSVPGCKQTFLSLNTQVAPWNDANVRRAFAYALDRTQLAGLEGQGAIVYNSFFPPMVLQKVAAASDINSLVNSLPTYNHSLTQAKALMAQAGHASGVSGVFEVPDDSVTPTIAQAIASMVAPAGINLQVKVLSENQYTQRIGQGKAQQKIQLTIQRLDCSEEPNSTADAYLDSSQADVAYANYAAYKSPSADQLLKAGISANDKAHRFTAYSQLDKLVAQDVPYIPLYLSPNVLALSSKFTWPELNPFSSVYGPASWVAQVKPAK